MGTKHLKHNSFHISFDPKRALDQKLWAKTCFYTLSETGDSLFGHHGNVRFLAEKQMSSGMHRRWILTPQTWVDVFR